MREIGACLSVPKGTVRFVQSEQYSRGEIGQNKTKICSFFRYYWPNAKCVERQWSITCWIIAAEALTSSRFTPGLFLTQSNWLVEDVEKTSCETLGGFTLGPAVFQLHTLLAPMPCYAHTSSCFISLHFT